MPIHTAPYNPTLPVPGGKTLCPRGLSNLATLFLFFVTAFLYSSTLIADTVRQNTYTSDNSVNTKAEIAHIDFKSLSKHPEWLALLHFDISLSGQAKRSYVLSDDYFLADDGKTNPEAELKATLLAFTQADNNAVEQALCQFPARRLWLAAKVELQFPVAHCPEFEEWANFDVITSISMVFATGHFASPASFFGHNFLKINTSDASSYLLDTAINFGAIIPPNENPVTYLANGIFGGYEATYSAEPFFRFLAKYGEQDLRDIWEYELDLSDEQRVLLISHLWEIKDKRFPYLFLSQNCAFHIATLLNLFTEEEFLPKYLPWAMPISVFDKLNSTELDGKPLVKKIDLHRSRRTLFQDGFRNSSRKQKALIRQYADNRLDLNDESALGDLSANEQIGLVDTLLDYSAFMVDVDDGIDHKEKQRQLLLKRMSLNSQALIRPPTDQSKPPHLGQRPGFVSLGALRRNGHNAGIVKIRPAYYDFLSLTTGRKEHASFTLLNTELEFSSKSTNDNADEENYRLKQFELFNLSNLNTHYSGIALDSASSWQLRLANEPVSDVCERCNAWFLQWDIGKAKKLNSQMAVFALAGASINESRDNNANGALRAQLGVTGTLLPQWRIHAKVTYSESFNRHQAFHSDWEVESRFGKSRWWDIRAHYRYRQQAETGLSVGVYW